MCSAIAPPRSSTAEASPQARRAGFSMTVLSASSRPPTASGERTTPAISSPSRSRCSTPAALRAADSSTSSAICQPATPSVSSPVASRSQSIPKRSTSATRPARFSAPRRRSRGISSGHRARPLPSPWVSEAEQNPPLRPEACSAIRDPSSTRTEEPGSASKAARAAHSPVNPAPTTTVSTVTAPRSGGRASGRSTSSSQKEPSAAARHRPGWVTRPPRCGRCRHPSTTLGRAHRLRRSGPGGPWRRRRRRR